MTRSAEVVLIALDGAPLPVTLKENLGIAYLTQVLRGHNITTILLDQPEMALSDAEILKQVVHAKPRLVGFSTVFTNISRSLDMAADIKRLCPGTLISLGGHHVLTLASSILSSESQVTMVFLGEAERSLLQVIEHLRRGLHYEQLDVPGVVHRHNKRTVSMGQLGDLDFGRPARDAQDCRRLRGCFPIAFVCGSRGCYGHCSFCSDPLISGLSDGVQWRGRGVDSIIDEVEELVARYGVRYVIFSDDDFIGSYRRTPNRLREFAQGMQKRSIRVAYRFSTRANNVLAMSSADFALLKDTGLDRIYVGIESGSTADLKLFRKGVTIEQNLAACQRMREMGVPIQIGFIMFHPYSTFEGILENCGFLARSGQAAFFKNFTQQFEAFPGTELSRAVSDDGLYSRKDLLHRDCRYRLADGNVEELMWRLQDVGRCSSKLDQLLFKVMYTVPRCSRGHGGPATTHLRRLDQLARRVSSLNVRFVTGMVRQHQTNSPSEVSEEQFRREVADSIVKCEYILADFQRDVPRFSDFESCVKE